MVTLLQSLQLLDYVSPTRIIRCDNAGEIVKLPDALVAAQLIVTFEYTPPGSPQFNGVVERKFQTLYARVRAILNDTKFPTPLRNSLWAEAANFATDLHNMLVTASKPTSSWFAFHGVEHPFVRTLHKFGALAIVEDHRTRQMRNKLSDRGLLCAYVGPAPQHASDCYRFLNLQTNAIIRSRDVTWLTKSYVDLVPLRADELLQLTEPADDDEDALMTPIDVPQDVPIVPEPIAPPVIEQLVHEVATTGANTAQVSPVLTVTAPIVAVPPLVETVLDDEDDGPPVHTSPMSTPTGLDAINPRLERELRRLDADIAVPLSSSRTLRSGRVNDMANVLLDLSVEDWIDIFHELNDLSLNAVDYEKINPSQYKDMFLAPTNFNDAWNHPCPFQRERWRSGIT